MTTPVARQGRGLSGWVVAFVAGVSAGTAVLLAAVVAVFVAIGEPLRFDGLEATGRVLQGAFCLTWAGSWLWLRWRLQRSATPRTGLQLLFAALAPVGLFAFAVPFPRDPWLVPVLIATAWSKSSGPPAGKAGRRASARSLLRAPMASS